MGAPTDPIIRALAEDPVDPAAVDVAAVDVDVEAGEPTETDRGAQAAAGRSAVTITAMVREGNRFIVTPNAEVVCVRAARLALRGAGAVAGGQSKVRPRRRER
jgi:hypothetical protein